jgi:hypothetical protein
MGYFKFLNKILPASPDAILKKATDAEAALARMAHVNTIVNDLSDIAHYELDVDATLELPINTNKGVIDIINFDTIAVPEEGFTTSVVINLINTPILNVANRDNLYIQITPYYAPNVSDNFIPYVLVTGATDGLNITIWNANPATPAANNGEGAFYLYYEIKTLA